jgi:hypothetical protein
VLAEFEKIIKSNNVQMMYRLVWSIKEAYSKEVVSIRKELLLLKAQIQKDKKVIKSTKL